MQNLSLSRKIKKGRSALFLRTWRGGMFNLFPSKLPHTISSQPSAVRIFFLIWIQLIKQHLKRRLLNSFLFLFLEKLYLPLGLFTTWCNFNYRLSFQANSNHPCEFCWKEENLNKMFFDNLLSLWKEKLIMNQFLLGLKKFGRQSRFNFMEFWGLCSFSSWYMYFSNLLGWSH